MIKKVINQKFRGQLASILIGLLISTVSKEGIAAAKNLEDLSSHSSVARSVSSAVEKNSLQTLTQAGSNTISKLPEDVMIPILALAFRGEEGISTYQAASLVCKNWKSLSNEASHELKLRFIHKMQTTKGNHAVLQQPQKFSFLRTQINPLKIYDPALAEALFDCKDILSTYRRGPLSNNTRDSERYEKIINRSAELGSHSAMLSAIKMEKLSPMPNYTSFVPYFMSLKAHCLDFFTNNNYHVLVQWALLNLKGDRDFPADKKKAQSIMMGGYLAHLKMEDRLNQSMDDFKNFFYPDYSELLELLAPISPFVKSFLEEKKA